jgi:hypothetical protein
MLPTSDLSAFVLTRDLTASAQGTPGQPLGRRGRLAPRGGTAEVKARAAAGAFIAYEIAKLIPEIIVGVAAVCLGVVVEFLVGVLHQEENAGVIGYRVGEFGGVALMPALVFRDLRRLASRTKPMAQKVEPSALDVEVDVQRGRSPSSGSPQVSQMVRPTFGTRCIMRWRCAPSV